MPGVVLSWGVRLLPCRQRQRPHPAAPAPSPPAQYWPTLLPMVQRGELDPALVFTHRLPLTEAARAYKIFNDVRSLGAGGGPGCSRTQPALVAAAAVAA